MSISKIAQNVCRHAPTIKKILEENGIQVNVINRDKGYFIFKANKC